MRYRNPIFGILSLVVAGLLLQIFKETSWAIFVESFLEEAARSLGIPRAAMVATVSQILLGGGMVWASLYFAFRVGRAERPDQALEAQRRHTEAILAQTEALRANYQTFPETVAPKSVKLDPSWSRDVLLSDALWRAYSGYWVGPQLPETILQLENAAIQIRQHAFEGRLPVWAKKPRSSLYELVPPSFWRNHTILTAYSIASLASDVFVQVTHALIVGEVQHARTMAWEDFMTSREAVERLWPQITDNPTARDSA